MPTSKLTTIRSFNFGFESVQQLVTVYHDGNGGFIINHSDNGEDKEWGVDCEQELDEELTAMHKRLSKYHYGCGVRFGAYVTDLLDDIWYLENGEEV